MAEHEPDGINEVFASSTRVALTAAGLVIATPHGAGRGQPVE